MDKHYMNQGIITNVHPVGATGMKLYGVNDQGPRILIFTNAPLMRGNEIVYSTENLFREGTDFYQRIGGCMEHFTISEPQHIFMPASITRIVDNTPRVTYTPVCARDSRNYGKNEFRREMHLTIDGVMESFDFPDDPLAELNQEQMEVLVLEKDWLDEEIRLSMEEGIKTMHALQASRKPFRNKGTRYTA